MRRLRRTLEYGDHVNRGLESANRAGALRLRPASWRFVVTRTESLFILLNLLDAGTTLAFTLGLAGGWDNEGNPLFRWVGVRYGSWALALKMLLAVAVPPVLRWFFSTGQRERMLYAVNAGLGAVVVWNITMLAVGGVE
jgi:hypothetical protein